MKRHSIWTGGFSLLLLPFLLAGCGAKQTIEAFTNEAEQARAHEWIEKLRRGEFDALVAKSDPSLSPPNIKEVLQQMSMLVPAGEPTERKLIGAHRQLGDGTTTVNLTYQYRFGEKYLLINFATREKDGDFTIVGMNVEETAGSLDETNAFTLAGKGILHYVVLALAVAFPVLTFVALFLCVRDRNLKRKWLWVLAILFGVGQLSLDWTTGVFTLTPLYVMLFSAGFFKPTYGPLLISIALPAGAVAYLVRRRNSPDTEVSNPTR